MTCREFAAAMYRAGQSRREVRERLVAMGRWTRGTIADAVNVVEGELGLSFPHGNRRRERAS